MYYHDACSARCNRQLQKNDGKAEAPRGFDLANLDTSVSPKDDFYDFACGGWMKSHPLSSEYSALRTFASLPNSTAAKYATL